jgi:hypothetical protein
LTVALKPDLAAWAHENEPRVLALIADDVRLGYRVSVKEEDEGFSASMAFIRETGPNKGLVLVERASTPQRALLRLLWAHHEHFHLVWPKVREVEGDDW